MTRLSYYSIRTTIVLAGFMAALNVFAAEDKPLNIYTVNYPLKFFSEKIAGKNAVVTLPMPNDIDPAFWSPNADDIAGLQQADLILLNGANYAKWLPKVSLPLFKLANTSSEFRGSYIALKAELKHKHGTGGEHTHTGTAFTTWLDFSLAEKQAAAVFKALSKKRPSQKQVYVKNFMPLQQSLLELDKEMSEIGKELNGMALIGSHPVYQYLQKRYQLNMQSVHWEPGDVPTEEQLAHLQTLMQSHPANWMLWEDEPAEETRSKLEALGINSIVFNPCANLPAKGDFLSVMHENVDRLKNIITK